MNDVLMLGRRDDGRPVFLIGGGAGDPAPTGDPAPAAADPAPGTAGAEGAGDGAEEVEFTEDAFKALIEKHNAAEKSRAERDAALEAEREEWRKKLHNASQDASKARQRARALAAMIGDEAAAKPGSKGAAQNPQKGEGERQENAPDPEVARLAAELKATQMRMLTSEAQAALLRAEATPKHVERLVRMLDLNAGDRDDAPSVAEQITELKAEMPELFTPPASAAAPPAAGASNGTGVGARVLRAAPAVTGKGAAGRGGEAPRVPTTAEILANRLLGKSEE